MNHLPTIESLYSLWLHTPNNRKLIGIDWGEKRIGLAVSDRSGLIASPLCTVLYKKNKIRPKLGIKNQNTSKKINKSQEQLLEETLQNIIKIIKQESPIALSIGLPINMNGSLGFQSQKVIHFAKKLSEEINIPYILYDERLSSAAVEKSMIHADLTRIQRQKIIDETSAAYVLQGVIDQLNKISTFSN